MTKDWNFSLIIASPVDVITQNVNAGMMNENSQNITDRDKFIQQKKEEVEKISKEQLRLSKEFKAIAKRPVAKRIETQIERCFKLARLAIIIKQLEIQKHLIIAQPFPKFPKGSPSVANRAIVGDSGNPEIILTPNHLQP